MRNVSFTITDADGDEVMFEVNSVRPGQIDITSTGAGGSPVVSTFISMKDARSLRLFLDSVVYGYDEENETDEM